MFKTWFNEHFDVGSQTPGARPNVTEPAHSTPEPLLSKALALLQEGKCSPASGLFSEYLRENPECADAYVGRGRCAAATNEHFQAI